MELKDLYNDAFSLIEKAVNEQNLLKTNPNGSSVEGALFFYLEAIELLFKILKSNTPFSIYVNMEVEPDENKRIVVKKNTAEYLTAAEALKEEADKEKSKPQQIRSANSEECEKEKGLSDFALSQAISADQKGETKEALELYADAAEHYLKYLKLEMDDSKKSNIKKTVATIMTRAEFLKGSQVKKIEGNFPIVATEYEEPKGQKLSKSEKEVLAETSRINGRLYLPFIIDDLNEQFMYQTQFKDPDGLLELSRKQLSRFHSWKRPIEITRGKIPKVIYLVSSYTITQTLVSDCSIVGAVSVSAAYERRHKKQLVTQLIYPQNNQGEPIYNPCGKYMIKLLLNGIWRKIVIDDLFPCDMYGNMLCSYSNNSSEYWVSLIEKAYMKVHGGYAFPGGSSEIDLHCLTGWIPEVIHMNRPEFDSEREWKRILNGLKFGDCLVTISTGRLNENSEETLGLIPTHAYAVLDVREVNGIRLLQVKNPWSQIRWKGKYSQNDLANWTPALQKELNYDLMNAIYFDNGIFWIDYDSVKQYFELLHMNWNPELFAYNFQLHSKWSIANTFLKQDTYSMGDNPQFRFTVNNTQSDSKASAWILLTKHVTTKEERNNDFITMHVYDKANGHRVYYPEKPFQQGIYINSPHYLVRFDVPEHSKNTYTLVVSQYEKISDINFTINAYCTSPFEFETLPSHLPFEKKILGSWNAQNSGGCPNFGTYKNNPQYALSFSDPVKVIFIKLECNEPFSVNVSLARSNGGLIDMLTTRNLFAESGDYRKYFCYLEARDVQLGTYILVPSTFNPSQLGKYRITIGATTAFEVNQLQ